MDCDVLEGVREEGEAECIRSGGNLNVVCWNVCGWCKDGSSWKEMRAVHDMRAEVIDCNSISGDMAKGGKGDYGGRLQVVWL